MPKPLKLNGKEVFTLHRISSNVLKIKAFLDKQRPDEIYTPDELERRINARVRDYRMSPELEGYSSKIGQKAYWGNPRAIAALREQVNA